MIKRWWERRPASKRKIFLGLVKLVKVINKSMNLICVLYFTLFRMPMQLIMPGWQCTYQCKLNFLFLTFWYHKNYSPQSLQFKTRWHLKYNLNYCFISSSYWWLFFQFISSSPAVDLSFSCKKVVSFDKMTASYWQQVKLNLWKSWLVRKRKPVSNFQSAYNI